MKPRLRFSVRWLMVVVAIVALMAGAVQRRGHCLRIAAFHAQRAAEIRRAAEGFFHHGEPYDGIQEWKSSANRFRQEALQARQRQSEAQQSLDARLAARLPTSQQDRREPWYWQVRAEEAEWSQKEAEGHVTGYQLRIQHHDRMRRLCERAAYRPWQSVPDEPEPPEFYPPLLPLRRGPPPP